MSAMDFVWGVVIVLVGIALGVPIYEKFIKPWLDRLG